MSPARTRQREAIARQKAHGDSLRAWLQDRAAAATKRRTEARATAAKEPQPSRGVNRVPAQLQGLHQTFVAHTASKPRLNPDGSIRRGGHTITTEDRPAGNYAMRRARGQRGKQRRPRIRELRRAREANMTG